MLRFLLDRKLRALVVNLENSIKWFSKSERSLEQILKTEGTRQTDVVITHKTASDYDFTILQHIFEGIQNRNINELAIYLPDVYFENSKNLHRGIKHHINLNLTSLIIHSFNKSTAVQILGIRSANLVKVSFSFDFDDHDFYEQFYNSFARFLTYHSAMLQTIFLKCFCRIPFESTALKTKFDNMFICNLKSVKFILQNLQFSSLEQLCIKIIQSHLLTNVELSHSLLVSMINQIICVSARNIVIVLPKKIIGVSFFVKVLEICKMYESLNFAPAEIE